ncbi:MAG TPA: porin [Candidatus Thalassarchaeaceae archaeon]|jgi:aquaporin Z|nr:porin [Euryarchaeota archaeon]DAC42686.1 MAG TPA: porin [Candidatus Poseidoniales archaeon]HII35333.1 porin [Candidatus Thalassarchaeaceae archaeon]|tara:strand:+ start:2506 stop:3141 length:636 start_codon:yes stop_codon:yes gene_type:complete
MTDNSIRPKLIAEFIGTFFLALTICTAAVHGSAGELAPFAIASTLMVMIYSVGHISGAHFNPAVTVAVWLRGACDRDDVAPYIATQISAGALAAVISQNILSAETDVSSMQMITTHALGAEFLYTFALVYVILNVATSEATEGNGYFGASIAFVVLAGALTVGEISGGSFNPAVTGALYVSGVIEIGDLWIHLIPQFTAGLLAVQAFKATQ